MQWMTLFVSTESRHPNGSRADYGLEYGIGTGADHAVRVVWDEVNVLYIRVQ